MALEKASAQRGFSNAGVVLQKDMPLGQYGHQHLTNHRVFPNNRLSDFADNGKGFGMNQKASSSLMR